MASVMMSSFWELQSTQTFSWQSSWWWKSLRLLSPTTFVAGWCLYLTWWRNSRLVGWRSESSDYEGHQSKEATKEFKILFFGIIYKATWNLLKSHGEESIHLIALLGSSDCFVSQHFFTQRWDQKSQFWSAMRRRIRFFTCCGNTSWTNISI